MGLALFVLALNVVRTGLSGAVASTVRVISVEAPETFPAASVAVAVTEWTPSASAVDGVKVHAPVVKAFVIPMLVAPSKIVTVLLASAVPAIMGLPWLMEPRRLFRTGLPGGVKSTVKMIGFDASEVFPASSFAFAVIVWVVAVNTVGGVKLQAPSDAAMTIPKAVEPS